MIYNRVFEIFEEISAIPRGSGNMSQISRYCVETAKRLNMKFFSDQVGNVIIYKPAPHGYEENKPVILQGHIDMVCQKTNDTQIDFKKDGISIFQDGDFIKAHGTTLGADNGIAVAMIMAILESDDIMHPPIEAVFTADEEIGMIGAGKLDFSRVSAKRMINLDAESPDVITVSCAGGCEAVLKMPIVREKCEGTRVKIILSGLQGGHSGIEIDKGRVNAIKLIGTFLKKLKKDIEFNLIIISGGEKRNAIPTQCCAELLVENYNQFEYLFEKLANDTEKELRCLEPGLCITAEKLGENTFSVLSYETSEKLINSIICAPNGVQSMSADVKGLVETSLNLGVISTYEKNAELAFLLRGNKTSSLNDLILKLEAYSSVTGCVCDMYGFYPPWEYKNNSELRQSYKDVYKTKYGAEPLEEAIHAGMECGVFAENIEDFDCISFGPVMHDIHTVNERLSISSVKDTTELLVNLLNKL